MRLYWLCMSPLILIAGYWNLSQAVQAFGFAAALRVLLIIQAEIDRADTAKEIVKE